MKSSKGMTLLEILIALVIFTFMFVFIVQTVKQSRRQVQKIQTDIKNISSFDYVIELIKEDFNSVAFFFDLNDNFRKGFPIKLNTKESRQQGASSIEKNDAKKPVFLSPYFVFRGEEDKIEFVSYSLTGSSLDQSIQQWIQIRYFIQDCETLDKSSVSPCLIRSSKRYWDMEGEREEEETLTLLRDFKSLKFSYLDGGELFNQKWQDQWKVEKTVSFSENSVELPQELPFPFRVKIEMEKQDREYVWNFNVANFYLVSWNPFSKEFFEFPKWTPAKKESKAKSEERTAQ